VRDKSKVQKSCTQHALSLPAGELRCWQLEPEVRPAEVTSAEVRPADNEAEEKAEEDSEESEQTVQIVQ
jgi:hypothetical protein